MPGENENHRNISHHGIKASQNHAARALHDANSVGCPEMPDGILGAPLNPDPHGAGPKTSPYMPASSRRPRDEPKEMRPPHDPAPHPYNPAGQKQQANPYMPKRP